MRTIILGQIEGVIEEVAMKAASGDRDNAVETKLDEIREAIAHARGPKR